MCVGRVRRQRQSVRRPRADKGGKVCVCECKQSAGSPRQQQRAHTAGNHFVFSKSAQYALAQATAARSRAKDKVVPGVDAVGEVGGGSCRYR